MVAKKGPRLVSEEAVKFSLTVRERIMLPTVLPQKGTAFMLKLMNQFMETISFSQKEITTLELHQNATGGMAWKPEGEEKVGEKKVAFPDTILQLVRKSLKEMDKKEELTKDLLSLYEKLVPSEE